MAIATIEIEGIKEFISLIKDTRMPVCWAYKCKNNIVNKEGGEGEFLGCTLKEIEVNENGQCSQFKGLADD